MVKTAPTNPTRVGVSSNLAKSNKWSKKFHFFSQCVGCLNIVFLVVAMRLFATYHNYLICIEYIRDILNGNTLTSFSYTLHYIHKEVK